MNRLYNADAADILPSIDTDSVDMIFTDPPYNTTFLKMDNTGFNIKDYLPEFKRILRPNGWFFCFGTMEMFFEIMQSQLFTKKFEYIWIKKNGSLNFYNTISPRIAHEIICAYRQTDLKKMTNLYMDKESLRTEGKPYQISRKTKKETSEFRILQKYGYNKSIKNTGYREGTTVLKNYPSKSLMQHAERTTHPTQKPLELCKLITKAYCPPNGVILDPFMGSGTIPLAAKLVGRKYIGIELNKEYYEIADKRVRVSMTQKYDNNNINDKLDIVVKDNTPVPKQETLF